MNKLKTVFAILLIALIITAGFILPSAISVMYDRKDASGSSSVEVETIKLDPGQRLSFIQRINILAGSPDETPISSGRLLTEEDAISSTEKLIFSLTESLGLPLYSDSYSSIATPYLVVSSDASVFSTIVIWNVIIEYDNGGYISAMVDEESGLIIGAGCSLIGDGYGVYAPWPANPDEICKYLADTYASYLGLSIENDSYFKYTSDKSICYMFCTLSSGSESCNIMVSCDPYGFSISPDYSASETETSTYDSASENDAALMP